MTSYKIPRAREMHVIPNIWNAISETSDTVAEIHGATVSTMYGVFEGRTYRSIYVQKEWDEVERSIADRLVNDPEYLEQVYEEQERLGEELRDYTASLRASELPDNVDALLELCYEIRERWLRFDRVNVAPWFWGADRYQELVKERLRARCGEIATEDMQALFAPLTKSFSSEEEQAVLELVEYVQEHDCDLENPPAEVDERFRALTDRFYWIPFGYDGPDVNTVEDYKEEVRARLDEDVSERLATLRHYHEDQREEQERLYEEYGVDDELQALVERAHVLAEMQDHRKEVHYPLNVVLDGVLHALADALGVDWEVLKFSTLEEIEEKASGELRRAARRRKEGLFCFKANDAELELLDENAVANLQKELREQQQSGVVEGRVASTGGEERVTGTVRVAETPEAAQGIGEDEILVTSMTTPRYTSAMRKCKAVVTDEGGVTSHAAIVSRELGLPCIIGTGNATRVLSTGDEVVLDLEAGRVRKL